MSFENLKNNYSKLLEFLEKEKYSATVIRCVSREIKNSRIIYPPHRKK